MSRLAEGGGGTSDYRLSAILELHDQMSDKLKMNDNSGKIHKIQETFI